MQKYKTIEELSEYLDNTNLRVMKREGNIVHFNNGFRAEVEFEKEYFI